MRRIIEQIDIPGRMAEVEWVDAVEMTGVDVDDIMEKPISEFCMVRKTPGRLVKEDEFGVVLIADMDEADICEIWALPRAWILKITYYDEATAGESRTVTGTDGWI